MLWNSMAIILTVALIIVLTTTGRILYIEHKRRKIFWGSRELIAFAITGATVVVLLWGMMVAQWLRL